MMSPDEVRREKVVMHLVQLYAQTHLPSGLILHAGDEAALMTHIDLATQDLVLSMRAFALGDEGPRLHEEHTWYEYVFPRYVPKWLRRRWAKKRVIHLSFQGKVIYPEQRVVAALGPGVRVVELDVYGPRP